MKPLAIAGDLVNIQKIPSISRTYTLKIKFKKKKNIPRKTMIQIKMKECKTF